MSQSWRSDIARFVLDEVRNGVASNEELNPEVWQIWETPAVLEVFERAFIHVSIEPNEKDNYEQLELLGDRQLKISFANYALARFPDISVSELSELDSAVMSKIRQAAISVKMGLPQLLLAVDDSVRQNIDVQEDLFESLFGAVTYVGDKFFANNGASFAYNLLANIMSQEEIDFSQTLGNAITQVKELLEILPGGYQVTLESLETTYRTAEDKWHYILSLPPTIISAMRESIENRMQRIWTSLGNSPDQTSEKRHIEDFLTRNPQLVQDPRITLLNKYSAQLSNLPMRGIVINVDANSKEEARNEAYQKMRSAIAEIIDLNELLRFSRGINITDPNLRREIEIKLGRLQLDSIQPRFYGDNFDFYQLVGSRHRPGETPLYQVLLTYPRPHPDINHERETIAMLQQWVNEK